MPSHNILSAGAATIALSLLAMATLASETADVQLQKGYVDPQSGVKVEEIIVSPNQDIQEVHLSVPESAGPIEEVIITGQRRHAKRIPQPKPYHFAHDYDHNQYGLVIYLGKSETLPIRVYFDSAQYTPGTAAP